MGKKREAVLRLFWILLGSFVSSIALNSFIIPHKLLSGGVTGVSILIQYVTGLPSGYFILALNIPIFIIGIRNVDKDFTFFSLIGMLSLSGFLIITKDISKVLMVNDILLSCIYGGVVGGIGAGIVFRARASQGGTDIIAVVVKRKNGMNIATMSFAINIVIVIVGAFLSNVETAMYTLISMYVSSAVIDRVMDGLEKKKMLFIVTEKEGEVSNEIMKALGRGITLFYGEGAYTGDEKRVINCVVTSKQVMKIKKIIDEIDPNAFMSIVDASEVNGKGFKKAAL